MISVFSAKLNKMEDFLILFIFYETGLRGNLSFIGTLFHWILFNCSGGRIQHTLLYHIIYGSPLFSCNFLICTITQSSEIHLTLYRGLSPPSVAHCTMVLYLVNGTFVEERSAGQMAIPAENQGGTYETAGFSHPCQNPLIPTIAKVQCLLKEWSCFNQLLSIQCIQKVFRPLHV